MVIHRQVEDVCNRELGSLLRLFARGGYNVTL